MSSAKRSTSIKKTTPAHSLAQGAAQPETDYTVKVVRPAGTDPLTKLAITHDEQTFVIAACSPEEARRKGVREGVRAISFRGAAMEVYVNDTLVEGNF